MAMRQAVVHRFILLAGFGAAAAMAGCHRKADHGPQDRVQIVAPPPLNPITQQCLDPAQVALKPDDVQATCGLAEGSYLGVADNTGCQYIFQAGPNRASVRIQTRDDMTVAQAFEKVKVAVVPGIGDFAEEGSIRADMWILAAQTGVQLSYIEADKRLCSEAQTAQLLRLSIERLKALPGGAPASQAASSPASSPAPGPASHP
jgi:hypothetical protein